MVHVGSSVEERFGWANENGSEMLRLDGKAIRISRAGPAIGHAIDGCRARADSNESGPSGIGATDANRQEPQPPECVMGDANGPE